LWENYIASSVVASVLYLFIAATVADAVVVAVFISDAEDDRFISGVLSCLTSWRIAALCVAVLI
jgi:hypothetical protein